MSSSTNGIITEEFDTVISKSPPIFDEVLSKLASENDLLEKEMLTLKRDLLFTVLVVIMVEKGFQPIASNCDAFDPGAIDVGCLSKWKQSSGLYELHFQLLGFSDIPTKLIMIPLATTVLVNVVISGMEPQTYSVCLPIDQYVVLSMNETAVGKMFRNLQELSDTFKNKVLSPVKSELLSFCGYPGASLTEIPEDVFLKIMYCLSISDILSVCETCKKFKRFLRNDNFWHKLFFRDYKSTETELGNNWRALYEKFYTDSKIVVRPPLSPPVPRYQFPPFAGWMF